MTREEIAGEVARRVVEATAVDLDGVGDHVQALLRATHDGVTAVRTRLDGDTLHITIELRGRAARIALAALGEEVSP